MSTSPMKRAGFDQGIYQISETRKEELGTLRVLSDGRKFRYARAGGSDLCAGKFGVAAAIAAAHAEEMILETVAIGTKVLSVTVTAGTAILENELKGGAFQINLGTGLGYSYVIDANSAISAAETVVNLTLEEGIKVALDVTTEFTLVHNPWNDVIESTTIGTPVGVALVVVTTAYYYWAQTGGLGICLADGTPAAGEGLIQSNGTAGSLEVLAGAAIPQVAAVHGTAFVAAEYKPILLMID
jgi:hypothetical protein